MSEHKFLYSPSYLVSVVDIAMNEPNIVTFDDLKVALKPWLPEKRDKDTKEVIFPSEEDWSFMNMCWAWRASRKRKQEPETNPRPFPITYIGEYAGSQAVIDLLVGKGFARENIDKTPFYTLLLMAATCGYDVDITLLKHVRKTTSEIHTTIIEDR